MAAYTVLSTAPGDGVKYLVVAVTFGDHEFVQNLVTAKTGQALESQLQAYVDEYEAGFVPADEEGQ